MNFDDFLAYFNRIFVLHDVTQAESEWVSHRFLGEWSGHSAAGCLNNPNCLDNPQYSLVTKEPDTHVFVNLSQPDLRYALKKNLAGVHALGKSYHPIGIYALKVVEPDFRKTSYSREDKVAGSSFTDIRDLSFEFTLKTPGHYVLLPCTYDEKTESKFELVVFSNKPSEALELTKVKPSRSLKSEWKGARAGGCLNYRNTFMNNPQFLLVCSKGGTVDILLSQTAAPGKPSEAIAIYVLSAPTRHRQHVPNQILVRPKVISDNSTISESLHVEAGAIYIIIPTLFDPDLEREFTLKVASQDDKIEVFEELH